MLLLHGFTGHAHAWDTLGIALQPHFHVLALDQRGHGDSDPGRRLQLGRRLRRHRAASSISSACASFVLVGLSMGGRNGDVLRVEAARARAEAGRGRHRPRDQREGERAVRGPPEPDTWDSIEQAARHLFRGNPFPGIHYYRWVASQSLRARPDGALVWKWHPSVKERRSTGNVDWWAVVRAITPPTLVLRGEHSPILDRDVAERMAKELPNGRFVEIPQAVHTLHEDNPEAVLAALKDFLGF